MTKLITVHGTGGGAPDSKGELWWQLGCPFQTKVGEFLNLEAANVEVVPFHWDYGANSERARRAAGAKLYEKLSELDQRGEDYYLTGHSHGGSVIYEMLVLSLRKKGPLRRLKSWCTIGTPFLEFRAKRFLFSRLDTPALGVYSMALTSLILSLIILAGPYLNTTLAQRVAEAHGAEQYARFYVPMILAALLNLCIAFVILYIYERWRNKWFSDSERRAVADVYRKSWIGFWHHDDEAIIGLQNAKGLKARIIPADFLAPVFAVIPIILAVVGFFFLDLWLMQGAGEKKESLDAFLHHRWFSLSGIAGQLGTVLSGIAIFSGLVWMFKRIGLWIGKPAAKAVDSLVWTSVRKQAWGADLHAEEVLNISAHPPDFPLTYLPLPKELAEQISAYSDANATKTIGKARLVLGMTTATGMSDDLMTEISKQLNWRELIHTTYFDVEDFIRLYALAMHRSGLAGLRTENWPAGKRDEVRAWLAAIAAPAPAGTAPVPPVAASAASRPRPAAGAGADASAVPA